MFMKKNFSKYQFNWLAKEVDDLSIDKNSSDIKSFDMGIPKKYGIGTMSVENLSAGVTLFNGIHRFTSAAQGNLIPLTKFEAEFSEPNLFVQIPYGGQFIHDEITSKKFLVIRPGFSLFGYGSRRKLVAYLDGSDDGQMIGLSIPRASLDMFLGEGESNYILNTLKINSELSAEVYKISHSTQSILSTALSSPLTGKARKLHIQGKILEFFASFHHSLTEEESAPKSTAFSRKIKEHLLSTNGKITTLDELSKEFQLSARYLNIVFQKEYGESISSFLSNYRLAQAKSLLEQSTVPMKIIATNLGYSHVNHFITAFKKKFGCSPGSLRRNRANN